MNNKRYADEKQLTVRGLVIGIIGSVIITMSSMFIALKLSSLPWPIVFAALVSMFSLKLLGNTNMNEINVTHTAMSAGAMVAGGLAFTIPGIWILYPNEKPSMLVLMVISIGGTVLGLIFTALVKRHFIDEKKLDYPMGKAAADTLIAGDEGGAKAQLLFGTIGITAVFTALRDWFKVINPVISSSKMAKYGSAAGIWLSPMLIGIGYMLGPVMIGVWFFGAVIGDFGILFAGQKSGIFTLETAQNIKQSLGIGLMVGSGIGVLIKGVLPNVKEIIKVSLNDGKNRGNMIDDLNPDIRFLGLIAAAAAFAFATICDLGIAASILTIFGVWFAVAMSSECVGSTGINPMEIFGILVLLLVKLITGIGDVRAFYVAGIVAVSAGLVGDVMNDFKAGYVLKTSSRAQWISEWAGGIAGAITAVCTIFIIYKAYGGHAIGGEEFPAAQAAAVASMVGGISNLAAFITGVISAIVLYLVGFPVMTLGLGVYLPFYLSATAFLGGILRFITDRTHKKEYFAEKGNIIAAGCLGGEAIVGVIISIIIAIRSF